MYIYIYIYIYMVEQPVRIELITFSLIHYIEIVVRIEIIRARKKVSYLTTIKARQPQIYYGWLIDRLWLEWEPSYHSEFPLIHIFLGEHWLDSVFCYEFREFSWRRENKHPSGTTSQV